MANIRRIRWFGWLCMGIGSVLLIITALGQWTDAGDYQDTPPRAGERFDPTLVDQAPDYESLLQLAELRTSAPLRTLDPEARMQALFDVVVDRFTHQTARHTIFTNWLLWAGGFVNDEVSKIVDVDLLVAGGHSLVCSQSALLLTTLAEDVGVEARVVRLTGHVVMEAHYNDAWHAYDPDYEVIPVNAQGEVVSVDELSQDAALLQSFYANKIVRDIYTTRDNNRYEPTWKEDALHIIGDTAQILKFVLPILMVLGGGFLTIRCR